MAQTGNTTQRYLLLYEEYTEYNQFEGSWDKGWYSFADLRTAEAALASYSKSDYYRNLFLAALL